MVTENVQRSDGPSPRVRGSRWPSGAVAVSVRSIPACAGKPCAVTASGPDWRVHPRVCGEARSSAGSAIMCVGPSPRVRGSPPSPHSASLWPRSIPACAGKPWRQTPSGCRGTVHPRVCGEAHRGVGQPDQADGSIPACAGKPGTRSTCAVMCRVHPRVCGEAAAGTIPILFGAGPSPRVRGSRRADRGGDRAVGSIPACAGKPWWSRPTCCGWRVHPRVCGEATLPRSSATSRPGPSPRVRGSRAAPLRPPLAVGSIPACAGKPSPAPPAAPGRRVHPRVCGEARRRARPAAPVCGPSPRVRGSLPAGKGQAVHGGSIPACAGKPPAGPPRRRRRRVHPRVCGEAHPAREQRPLGGGPSPRVRGSRRAPARRPRPAGSIPACAGKPGRRAIGTCGSGVHPRVCGEAPAAHRAHVPPPGPSPRVRGSRQSGSGTRSGSGSIPACAGKPLTGGGGGKWQGVHPRVCGEAFGAETTRAIAPGPSPRVRGSRLEPGLDRAELRSIPACAGKPSPCSRGAPASGVHPRVCGEAGLDAGEQLAAGGPSPRVRGSLEDPLPALRERGSIPACAGKPSRGGSRSRRGRVHPRVCGEALPRRRRRPPAHGGPSPRVRGSPELRPGVAVVDGSIPACAGKPREEQVGHLRAGVHPRVCGEARTPRRRTSESPGPSPRVRGSRGHHPRPEDHRGSIPACAGKPETLSPRAIAARVHPRVCGEAARPLPLPSSAHGPSPRVRGSPARGGGAARCVGSIPACAGKPRWRRCGSSPTWVHPRVCGEAEHYAVDRWAAAGPSPRVRGSHTGITLPAAGFGSIPACAGKPRTRWASAV